MPDPIVEEPSNRTRAKVVGRVLRFIWVVDCSGSMSQDQKMATLNTLVREQIPEIRIESLENSVNATLEMQVLAFSDGARWEVSQPTNLETFTWKDLTADGVTDMGAAFHELANALDMSKMPKAALAPVLVLITDGQATDDIKPGLEKLLAQPFGKKSIRIGIGIGEDADMDQIRKFTSNSEYAFHCKTGRKLAKLLKWVSGVISDVSNPISNVTNGDEVLIRVSDTLKTDDSTADGSFIS